jgi:hypothetical protein
MKKFNKVITIEVSVDSIADKLLSTFDANFAHRDMLTETLIATAMDKNTIGYLYNSLNGYTNDVDFEVGQTVECTENVYQYKEVEQPISTDPNVVVPIEYKEDLLPLGTCVITEINPYTKDKLKVKAMVRNSKGELVEKNTWVNHLKCSGIPV